MPKSDMTCACAFSERATCLLLYFV